MSAIFEKVIKLANKYHNRLECISKRTCTTQPKSPSKQSPKKTQSANSSSSMNVPGLSSKMVNVPSTEVGPGASKKAVYKNPEYFCYHTNSYFDAEVEMMKYRLPQPSSRPSEANK